VSPRRGVRVTVPPPQEQRDTRFGTGDAADGREELSRHALANIPGCLKTLRADPRSETRHDRPHRFNCWTARRGCCRQRGSCVNHVRHHYHVALGQLSETAGANSCNSATVSKQTCPLQHEVLRVLFMECISFRARR
jgi:hypothetical protein